MTARVVDFDAFQRERKEQAGEEPDHPVVIIGGKEYILPSELPASVAVDVIRLKKVQGDNAAVPPEMLNTIGDALFGTGVFREILSENRLSITDMGHLIVKVFRLYDPDAGKETVPNRRTRRAKRSTSSKTGR